VTIIFNSWDRDLASFNDYYGSMPWAAIPFEYKEKLSESEAFEQPNGIPSLYLFNEKGSLYQKNGGRKLFNGQFPYEDPKFEEMFPLVLGTTPETWKQKEYIGLYFSAHWCPPCRGFTPILSKFYENFSKDRKDFELIFVSSDRNKKDFTEYFGSMSWNAALDMFSDNPAKAQAAKDMKDFLSSKCGVQGIPSLCILDKEGNIISKGGRGAVEEDPEGKDFPWKIPAIQNIDKSLEGINEKPSMILLCENQSPDEQASLESYMQPHANMMEAMGEKRKMMHFIVTKSSDLAGRVRGLMGSLSKDCLVLLNIRKKKFFVTDLPKSADDVGNFFAELEEGILEAKPLVM